MMKVNSKRAQEIKQYSYLASITDDIVKQIVVMVLYSFHLKGWRKKRINALYEQILSIIMMPKVFGQEATCESCMEKMTELYGIDFDRIKPNVESWEHYSRRKK